MKAIIKLILITFLISSCNNFMIDRQLLADFKTKNGEEVEIIFITAGATANDNMQVKKGGIDRPIWLSEKYNCLKSYNLIGDTSLQLIVADTPSWNGGRVRFDTLRVSIE